MRKFIEILPNEIVENPYNLIGRKWLLLTAGNEESFNTMTCSWGQTGVLWNKSVATVYVRPQRYTFGFMESNEYYTMSFFSEEYRGALNICGTKSGKDANKVKLAGLTPVHVECYTYFEEASLVLVCRKLYSQDMLSECFLDRGVDEENYSGDYHRQYVGEIVKVLLGR
ncbi:MAG: flavin reductase family protein [Clostridiales bacterium]|nr:flavin reductase family protein [Clostridiales bacterium]